MRWIKRTYQIKGHGDVMNNSINQEHVESLKSAIEEINFSLNSNKSKEVKSHYQKNAVKIIERVIETMTEEDADQ